MKTVRPRFIMEGSGTGAVPPRGSYGELREVLASGGTVGLAFDQLGATRTWFLGRDRALESEITRLALETGAAIVPVETDRGSPARLFAQLHPQISRDNYCNAERLQAAVAQEMEGIVLKYPCRQELPEYTVPLCEDPRRADR